MIWMVMTSTEMLLFTWDKKGCTQIGINVPKMRACKALTRTRNEILDGIIAEPNKAQEREIDEVLKGLNITRANG